MTSNIVSTPDTLATLNRHLSSLRLRIERVHSQVQAALNVIQLKLTERETVSARRMALGVVYECHTTVRAVKQLLVLAGAPSLSLAPASSSTSAPASSSSATPSATASPSPSPSSSSSSDAVLQAYHEQLQDERLDAACASLDATASCDAFFDALTTTALPLPLMASAPSSAPSSASSAPSSASSSIAHSLQELSSLMERLGRHWSRLKLLFSRAAGFALVTEWQSEVERLERQMERK